MAEIAKKLAKIIGYGSIGTALTAGIAYVATQFADAFSAIPTNDTPAMQVVKYTTAVGAAVAFAGAAIYQNYNDKTKWYSITPRGGKGKVAREAQDIVNDISEPANKFGHRATLAELLSDLGKDAVANDVAYDIGVKKVGANELVYVRRFERGDITGFTYTKEMSYQVFQLLDTKDVKKEGTDGANGKAYVELSLRQLQTLEDYAEKKEVKGGKKKPKEKKAKAEAAEEPEGAIDQEAPVLEPVPEPEDEPEQEGPILGKGPGKKMFEDKQPKAEEKEPGTT